MTPTIEDLVALGLRVGTVTDAEPNTGAPDPAYGCGSTSGISACCNRRRR